MDFGRFEHSADLCTDHHHEVAIHAGTTSDTLRFDLDFVRHGSGGSSVKRAEQHELRLYADTMVKFIRSNLAPGELAVNADIVTGLSDLHCVVIRFDEDRNRGVRSTAAPEDSFNSRLAELLHAPLTPGVQLRGRRGGKHWIGCHGKPDQQ